jgi:hypothetical protein
MKYKKPEMFVYSEEDVAEWAISPKVVQQNLPLVACGRSNPVDCMCTSRGSKAEKLNHIQIVACHCTSSGARVSHKAPTMPIQTTKAA